MKHLIRLSVSLCLFFSGMFLLSGLPGNTWSEGVDQYEEVFLKVDGIACLTCRWAIEGKLKEIPGVKAAKVTSRRLTWWNPFSKTEGKARITYGAGAVTVDQLIAAIEGTSDAVYTYKASLFPDQAKEE